MGSPVSRAPHEELGEDSDNEGSESEAEGSEPERPMPKAAPKPKAKTAPKPLTGWCALQAAIKQGDYSHLCLRVLCKSGKKCLQMSWGPLRFVDSMNVFPTSLASMIDDLRACTHKQLPELFPLMASLHPELQLRTPTDSKDGLSNSGGRTASWSRRGTASCASCPCPSSTSAAPRRGRCLRCGSSTAACWRGRR